MGKNLVAAWLLRSSVPDILKRGFHNILAAGLIEASQEIDGIRCASGELPFALRKVVSHERWLHKAGIHQCTVLKGAVFKCRAIQMDRAVLEFLLVCQRHLSLAMQSAAPLLTRRLIFRTVRNGHIYRTLSRMD